MKAQGQACPTGYPYNAVRVQQVTTIPMYFAGLFGHPTWTLTSVATASSRGGAPRPSNVVVIMDTTLSMNEYDTNCNATQENCALNGLQILLQHLSPCSTSQATCANSNGVITSPFDRVSLFTFPNVSAATASYFTSCTPVFPSNYSSYGWINLAPYGVISMLPANPLSGLPVALPYSFPTPGQTYAGITATGSTPTYQITPFLADYRTSDRATLLNAGSSLVKASGAVSGCNGLVPPNYEGDYETYYAGAIYAAQAALTAEHANYPGSENVIIIISDGDSNAWQSGGAIGGSSGYPNMNATAPAGNYSTATSGGSYPSWVGECGQAVTAAQYAATARNGVPGSLVYSVAYGSPSTGCATDSGAGAYPNISPCDTMADMASSPQYFFSDYNQSGSNSTCVASQPVTSLSAIFTAIANDLTFSKLIPNRSS